MRFLSMIAVAGAMIASSTAAFAGELPSYEIKSFPISTTQVQVLGGAGVEEQSAAPAMIVAGMVRLDIHFRAELHWPNTIELGLGVVKLGRTSVTFEQVVFSQGKCIASATSVGVLLDEATRRPAPLTAEVIEKLRPWHKRGIEVVPPGS